MNILFVNHHIRTYLWDFVNVFIHKLYITIPNAEIGHVFCFSLCFVESFESTFSKVVALSQSWYPRFYKLEWDAILCLYCICFRRFLSMTIITDEIALHEELKRGNDQAIIGYLIPVRFDGNRLIWIKI